MASVTKVCSDSCVQTDVDIHSVVDAAKNGKMDKCRLDKIGYIFAFVTAVLLTCVGAGLVGIVVTGVLAPNYVSLFYAAMVGGAFTFIIGISSIITGISSIHRLYQKAVQKL
ncbi:MAG: hypothetical protein HW387_1396 [Parachlamydiales bacterium]|nr:hypothetical protein [Parachlamydiales bacterium]